MCAIVLASALEGSERVRARLAADVGPALPRPDPERGGAAAVRARGPAPAHPLPAHQGRGEEPQENSQEDQEQGVRARFAEEEKGIPRRDGSSRAQVLGR